MRKASKILKLILNVIICIILLPIILFIFCLFLCDDSLENNAGLEDDNNSEDVSIDGIEPWLNEDIDD